MEQRTTILFLSLLFCAAGLDKLDGALNYGGLVFQVRYLVFAISLIGLISLAGSLKLSFYRRALPFHILWFIFGYSLIISGILNQDSEFIRDGVWAVIGIPILLFNIVPNLLKRDGFLLIGWGLFLGNLPYLLGSFILHPIRFTAYCGVFKNPNQMGLLCAYIIAGLLAILNSAITSNKSKIYVFILILSLLGAFAILGFSNSRTSALSSFVMGMLLLFHLMPRVLHRPIVLFHILSFLFLGVVVTFALGADDLITKIFAGISAKSGISGRSDMWLSAIQDVSLFGHGKRYFYDKFGFSGHNSVIDILGQNGFLSAVCLIGIIISSLFYTIRYYRKYHLVDQDAVIPVLFVVGFWGMSMSESMFGALGNSMTITFFLSVGMVTTTPSQWIENLLLIKYLERQLIFRKKVPITKASKTLERQPYYWLYK